MFVLVWDCADVVSANALELRLSCTNPSILSWILLGTNFRDATSYPKVGHVTEKLHYSGSNLPFGYPKSRPETQSDNVTYQSHNL